MTFAQTGGVEPPPNESGERVAALQRLRQTLTTYEAIEVLGKL